MLRDSDNVCAIVLNWNGWVDTVECLDSLAAGKVAPVTIVVVDNGSTDQSVERILAWAEERFDHVPMLEFDEVVSGQSLTLPPPFLIIRNPTNFGFSGGNNPAISWALQQNVFDFLWLLNNDTTVRSDTLGALLHCADQSRAGIYGSTIVHADNQKIVQCAGGCFYNPLTTIFRPYLADTYLDKAQQRPEQVDVDYIYGASLFICTEVFSRCGLLNDDYFLFYEEIDFCKRAEKEGYTLHWCKQSVILHKGSRSVGKPESAIRTKIEFANYHENLSTLLFTRRFYPWLLPLTMLFRFFGKLAVIGRRGDWYLARPLVAAYLDFFTGRNQRDKFLK